MQLVQDNYDSISSRKRKIQHMPENYDVWICLKSIITNYHNKKNHCKATNNLQSQNGHDPTNLAIAKISIDLRSIRYPIDPVQQIPKIQYTTHNQMHPLHRMRDTSLHFQIHIYQLKCISDLIAFNRQIFELSRCRYSFHLHNCSGFAI